MSGRSGGSTYPELVTGGEGRVAPDDMMFRVGSFRLRMVIDDRTFYLHAASMGYAMSSMPTCTVQVAIGRPSGPLARTITDAPSQPSDYDIITRLKPAKVYIDVLEFAPGGNQNMVGAALRPGTYLCFDGVVDGRSFQMQAKADASMQVRLAHRPTSLLGVGFSGFGPWTQGQMSDLTDYSSLFSIGNVPLQPTESRNVGDQFTAAMSGVLANLEIALNNRSNVFPMYAVFDSLKDGYDGRLAQALETLSFHATLRGNLTANAVGRINASILDIVADGGRTSNLLHMVNTVAQSLSMVYLTTAKSSYVFPYWPHRKLSEMQVLPAGSFQFTNFSFGSISGSGLFTAGALVMGTAGSVHDSANIKPGADTGAYLLNLTEDEKKYASIGSQHTPPYFVYDGTPVPLTDEVPTADYPRVTTYGAPSASQNRAKSKPGASTVDAGVAASLPGNQYARFLTLEGMLKVSSARMVTPLRWDVTPGKVLRMDQTRFGEQNTGPESAVYGHVTDVTIQMDAVSMSAQSNIGISHLHDYQDQMRIEAHEQGPFLYDTSHYQLLRDLTLFEEETDAE